MKTFSKNADARSKIQRSQDFYRTSRPQGANSSGNAQKANAANAGQIGKSMQKEDPTGSKRSKAAAKMSAGLNRELDAYLKTLSIKELIRIASKLEIEFGEDTTSSKLIEEIKYLISIYLQAISGKSKTIGPIPINDTAVDEIERIVGYTSSAWMVGKPVLSQKALKLAREKARVKKKELEAREKLINQQIKDKTFVSNDFKQLTGLSGNKKQIVKQLDDPKKDTGFLKDFDFEECIAKAYELGLDPDPTKSSLGEVKAAIYAKVAANMKEQKKLAQDLAKSKASDLKKGLKTPSNATKDLEASLKATVKVSDSIKSKGSGLVDDTSFSGTGGVPLISFTDGKLETRNITKAVPVFIVGQESAESLYERGKKEQDEKIKKLSDEDVFGLKGVASLLKKAEKKEEGGFFAKLFGTKDGREAARDAKKLGKDRNKILKQLRKATDKFAKDIFKPLIKKAPKGSDTEAIQKQLSEFQSKYSLTVQKIQGADTKAEMEQIANDFEAAMKEYMSGKSGAFDALYQEPKEEPKPEAGSPDYEYGMKSRKNQGGKRRKKFTFDSQNSEYSEEYIKALEESGKKGNKADAAEAKRLKKYVQGMQDIVSVDRMQTYGKMDKHVASADQSSENWGLTDDNKQLGDFIYYNTAAQKMLKKHSIIRGPVQPVFITNGFTEFLNDTVQEGFNKLIGSTGSIYQYLSTTMPILFQGLQQAGTAYNIASAGSILAKGLDIIQQIADGAMTAIGGTGDSTNVYKYATGGTGERAQKETKSSGSRYSQFITGDSKTNRVNPELVTIDWENQNFAVKPANESGNTVSNKTEMTTKERGSAFKVSFAEAMIRYQKSNEGETSDNLALKVYPITPGINDKININGNSVSLMDVMIGMYSSLTSIESLMSTNVELNKIIAGNGVVASKGSSQSAPDIEATTFPTNLDTILRGE